MTNTMEYEGIKVENVAKGKADWYLFNKLCKSCYLCIAKCPINNKGGECLKTSKQALGIFETPVVEPNPELCTGCGICATTCPDCAIKVVRK